MDRSGRGEGINGKRTWYCATGSIAWYIPSGVKVDCIAFMDESESGIGMASTSWLHFLCIEGRGGITR